MSITDDWMNSKKKTYWKIREANDTSSAEGSYCWVLFFTKEVEGVWETGVCGSECECKQEIKEAIDIRLKSLDLL